MTSVHSRQKYCCSSDIAVHCCTLGPDLGRHSPPSVGYIFAVHLAHIRAKGQLLSGLLPFFLLQGLRADSDRLYLGLSPKPLLPTRQLGEH